MAKLRNKRIAKIYAASILMGIQIGGSTEGLTDDDEFEITQELEKIAMRIYPDPYGDLPGIVEFVDSEMKKKSK